MGFKIPLAGLALVDSRTSSAMLETSDGKSFLMGESKEVSHPGHGRTVPLTTSLGVKLGQTGRYSVLSINVTTVGHHLPDVMTDRSKVFDRDIRWIVEALERHTTTFNQMRAAIGHVGEWSPLGQPNSPAPVGLNISYIPAQLNSIVFP